MKLALLALTLAGCATLTPDERDALRASTAVNAAVLVEVGIRGRCPREPLVMVGIRAAVDAGFATQRIILSPEQIEQLALARRETDRVCGLT